jgi:hypothetical protein
MAFLRLKPVTKINIIPKRKDNKMGFFMIFAFKHSRVQAARHVRHARRVQGDMNRAYAPFA